MRVKIILPLCLLFVSTALDASLTIKREVNLADFSEWYSGNEITLALHKAIDYCKEVQASKLIIPYGQYDILPDYAFERYVWVSNNDEGLKRFAFDLTGMEDFEIDGEGSTLMFHGYVSPFLILDSKRIKVRNILIDYVRTFHSEGVITNVRSDGIDVTFSDAFPYKIEQEMLFFYDAQGRSYPYGSLLEFDPVKRETAFMAKDYWLRHPIVARELEKGEVRIYKEGLTGCLVGNVMVFGAANRDVPGFTISNSQEVTICRVNIYHCGGMGVIAQRSRDIELSEVIISPAPESGRVVSITADATHFVQCGGYVHIINCLFEQQKDDATNIHGIYAAIVQILSPKEIVLKWKHTQQYGSLLGQPNDVVEIVASKSLITLSKNRIKKVEAFNKEFFKIEFEDEIPQEVRLNDVVASIHAPEVLIKGSVFRGNRARGLLLGSRGAIVIEENYFHIPGSAILFEGDGNYWYEQSGVNNVIIKNNVFDNCNYGVWGNALFQVGSGIYENREESRYHRNIIIEKNTIRVFDPRMVNIYCVDGFTFQKNLVKETNSYPKLHLTAEPFVVEHCTGVLVK